ncbi:unnamed protein product [Acanthoscelides obtectus]|uniref:Uncharacterized protein n=1 Tax=Acanthoscelides obtectus TaxID=200917 RepID=A0A9P0PQW6_ACAOB|nr:unnamed protein product [Acanthoscelides obtectus]CAK1656543.1 hypothetical protein AOBTE_LOCUS19791 [Acanthoscelides obtectus]
MVFYNTVRTVQSFLYAGGHPVETRSLALMGSDKKVQDHSSQILQIQTLTPVQMLVRFQLPGPPCMVAITAIRPYCRVMRVWLMVVIAEWPKCGQVVANDGYIPPDHPTGIHNQLILFSVRRRGRSVQSPPICFAGQTQLILSEVILRQRRITHIVIRRLRQLFVEVMGGSAQSMRRSAHSVVVGGVVLVWATHQVARETKDIKTAISNIPGANWKFNYYSKGPSDLRNRYHLLDTSNVNPLVPSENFTASCKMYGKLIISSGPQRKKDSNLRDIQDWMMIDDEDWYYYRHPEIGDYRKSLKCLQSHLNIILDYCKVHLGHLGHTEENFGKDIEKDIDKYVAKNESVLQALQHDILLRSYEEVKREFSDKDDDIQDPDYYNDHDSTSEIENN